VEGGEEPAVRSEVGTGGADDDIVLHDAGGHRDRVAGPVFGKDSRAPDGLSSGGVESDEPAVQDGRDNLAFVESDAAIEDAAADAAVLALSGVGVWDFRIEAPEFAAGLRVEGEDDAPVGDAVESAVGEERRGFLVAAPGS